MTAPRLRSLTVATLIAMTAGALSAQTSSPRFDVISIRPVQTNGQPILLEPDFDPVRPGGRYVDPHTALMFLIPDAYNIKDPSRRLIGLPKWAGQLYSVAAQAADDFPALPPRENAEQVRLMLRELLRDRFKLRLRTEMRQEDVLVMTVEKSGLRMKEVAAPVPPEPEGRVNAAMSDRGGRLIARKGTMKGLASVVGLFLTQEVVDQTGLSGYYDFDFRWEASPTDAGRSGSGVGAEGLALFLSEVKERFGLRFTKQSAPVEYWIIDHVEPPTENP